MKHGISFKEVDNTLLQAAIAAKASKERITHLKAQVSWDAVYGFIYDEVDFEFLGNILCFDYAFTPFKFALKEDAIYDKQKHPNAYGRIRGRSNVNNTITWLCLDVDKTTTTAEEMHSILKTTNHHIALTSDPSNKYKYRIILELSSPAIIPTDKHWKPFVKSIADSIGVKADMLGRSQVFYGYKGRKVYSTTSEGTIDPSTHLKMAHIKVQELEEKLANAYPKHKADKLLQHPFQQFEFAYTAESGEGTTKMLAAIHKAKELGASRKYIVDLVHSINNFWDSSMPQHRLESTVLTAI